MRPFFALSLALARSLVGTSTALYCVSCGECERIVFDSAIRRLVCLGCGYEWRTADPVQRLDVEDRAGS